MRSPICAFLGHVDAGKTSIIDAIRDTFFAYRESGGLTQNIGSTEVPTDRIMDITADLLQKFKIDIKIPSIIFIDSPGHEAFTTLRERGASIADLAILTVDATEGVQKQTIESIEILKSYKTPFLIAFTKIDAMDGFILKKDMSFLDFLNTQNQKYKEALEKRLYETVAELSNYGFQAERYDRVADFTKEVALVPLSSINNLGVKDLIVMIIGLSQRFMSLEKTEGDQAAIIEEKFVKGIGTVYDAIVYSGKLCVGDKVLLMSKDGVKETKIKGMMRLIPLEESRENFGKYESIREVGATAPIRLILQEPSALIGTSVAVFRSGDDRKRIADEMAAFSVGYNDDAAKGVVVCADSLGSIDAIRKIGASNDVQIGKTRIGSPSKNDISTAKLNKGVMLCFNVPVDHAIETMAGEEFVTIIKSNSIYGLFEKYGQFIEEFDKKSMENKTGNLKLPAKIVFIEGDIFRRSNPCVFGVEILAGEIRPGYAIINKRGERIGRILEIQTEKAKLQKAQKGEKVAISVDNAVYERNVKDGEVFYTDLDIQDVIKFEDVAGILSADYSEAIEEIQKIKKF